jgi:hypothetical protein
MDVSACHAVQISVQGFQDLEVKLKDDDKTSLLDSYAFVERKKEVTLVLKKHQDVEGCLLQVKWSPTKVADDTNQDRAMLEEVESDFAALKEKDLNVPIRTEDEKCKSFEDYTASGQVKNDCASSTQEVDAGKNNTMINNYNSLKDDFGKVTEDIDSKGIHVRKESERKVDITEGCEDILAENFDRNQEKLANEIQDSNYKNTASLLSTFIGIEDSKVELEPPGTEDSKPTFSERLIHGTEKVEIPELTLEIHDKNLQQELLSKTPHLNKQEENGIRMNIELGIVKTPLKREQDGNEVKLNSEERTEVQNPEAKMSEERVVIPFCSHGLLYNHNSVLTAEPIENIDFDENYFTRKTQKTINRYPSKKKIEESGSKKKRPTGVNSECCICFSKFILTKILFKKESMDICLTASTDFVSHVLLNGRICALNALCAKLNSLRSTK